MASAITSSKMTLIKQCIQSSTHVTFPHQEVNGISKIIDVARLLNGKVAVILSKTPFHPVDKYWPDQPADKGIINLSHSKKSFPVEDCQVLAIHKDTQQIRDCCDIPKNEKDGWFFVVGHFIETKEVTPESLIDADVELTVDSVYRNQLSLHHTASHLAAFAFNLATKKYWSKNAPKFDSLGSPNTDQLTIETSFIFSDRSEETYRFGQSIRKKGLQVNELLKNANHIQDTVNKFLTEWIATKTNVEIIAEGPNLNDTRKWKCHLPLGIAEMPCGGTHIANLAVFSKIEYQLEVKEQKDENRLFATIKIESSNSKD